MIGWNQQSPCRKSVHVVENNLNNHINITNLDLIRGMISLLTSTFMLSSHIPYYKYFFREMERDVVLCPDSYGVYVAITVCTWLLLCVRDNLPVSAT